MSTNERSSGTSHDRAGQGLVDPDLPSLGGVLIGSVLFVTGLALMPTVIGIPPGILLFAIGLGLMLEPKWRPAR